MLQAGARVADGQLPYRDFYANYGPGQYYLLGALDWMLGPSLLAWRVVRVLLDAAIAVLAYATRPPRRARAAGAGGLAGGGRRDGVPEPSAPQSLRSGARLRGAAARAPRRRPRRGRWRAWPSSSASTSGSRRRRGSRWPPPGAVAAPRRVPSARPRLVAGRASPALRRCGPGGVLGPDLRLRPRPAVAPAPAAAGRLRGRVRAQQAAAALFRLSAAGRRRRFGWRSRCSGGPPCGCGRRRRWPRAGVAYLLARADVFHLVPLAAVLPVLLATTAEHERRAGRTAWALPLVLVLALIALHGPRPQANRAARPTAVWQRSTSTWPTG